MKTIKFVLVTLFGFLGFIYAVILLYVYFYQGEMIFNASKLPSDYKFEFEGDFEELSIPSYDNVKLHGILFKIKKPKGLLFYLHGNSGALDTWGNIASIYNDLGYDIFILDYRGFGKSEGVVENEAQVNNDVLFAYQKLLSKYKEDKITVIGYSIGTGPATYLSSRSNPKSLILQAPYYNFLEYSETIVPFVPDFLKKFKFETNIFITKVKAFIYIFHGDIDNIIPMYNSVELSKMLKSNDRFYILKNQGHIGMSENQEYLSDLNNVLSK